MLDLPCTTDFARTEHGPASRVKDVNDAFDLAGVVSTFYRQIGGIDLTRLLGVDEGDHRSLSSTVRYCDPVARPPGLPAAERVLERRRHVLRPGLRLGRTTSSATR